MTRGKGKHPGASGLSKHVKRRSYGERQQPASRRHLGPLEKQKDYRLRARRRKAKVERIKQLKRAAAQRNPNEFAFDMTKMITDRRTGKKKKRRKGIEERRKDLRNEIDTQASNLRYLNAKETADRRKATSLLEGVHGLYATPQNTHTIFVEGNDAVDQFQPEKYFQTDAALLPFPAIRAKRTALASSIDISTLAAEDAVQRSIRRVGASLTGNETATNADSLMIGQHVFGDAVNNSVKAVKKSLKEASERIKRATRLRKLSGAIQKQVTKMQRRLNHRSLSRFRKGASVRAR